MCPHPFYHDRVFEGGPSNPEGMAFHYVIWYFCFLIMDTFGHGLVGGFDRKNGLGLYSCPLVQLGG